MNVEMQVRKKMCANQLMENRLKRLNAGLTNLFCQVTSDGATTTWSCILLLWLQTEIVFDCGVIEMWNTVDKSNANMFGHTDRLCHFILVIQISVSAMIKADKNRSLCLLNSAVFCWSQLSSAAALLSFMILGLYSMFSIAYTSQNVWMFTRTVLCSSRQQNTHHAVTPKLTQLSSLLSLS